MHQCFIHVYTYTCMWIVLELMQAYQYDEFEQPEWVQGQTGAVVQEMEIATTDMRILLILRSF